MIWVVAGVTALGGAMPAALLLAAFGVAAWIFREVTGGS